MRQKACRHQITRSGDNNRDRDSVRCAQIDAWWFSFRIAIFYMGGAKATLTSTFDNWSTDMRVTSILPISYTHRWCDTRVVVCRCACSVQSYAVHIVRIFRILFAMAIAHTHTRQHMHGKSGVVWHVVVEMLLCLRLTALFYYYTLIEPCLCLSTLVVCRSSWVFAVDVNIERVSMSLHRISTINMDDFLRFFIRCIGRYGAMNRARN